MLLSEGLLGPGGEVEGGEMVQGKRERKEKKAGRGKRRIGYEVNMKGAKRRKRGGRVTQRERKIWEVKVREREE